MSAFGALASPNAYDGLAEARRLATGGHRMEAVAILEAHLAKFPADVDAHLLFGTVLSWDGRYAEARTELERVLASKPDYADARLALINVELWSGRPERAEEIARTGLAFQPDSLSLLAARAKALRALKRTHETIDTLDHLLLLEPANREAREDRDAASDEIAPWTVRTEQTHEWFSHTYEPWHEYWLEAKRGTSEGPFLLRVSRAQRFGEHGNQAEVDWYPRLRAGTYAYINTGYSYDAALYPRYRAGAELYQAVPHSFELSGGFRRLGFSHPVNIYSAGLGKYYRNWWFNGRVYLTPDSVGTSTSVQIAARRYFGKGGDYLGFRIGRGSSPTEIENVTDLAILNATSVYCEFNKTLGRRWTLGLRGGTSREDRIGQPAVNRYLVGTSLAFRF
jgi:YaiO family outer membrane protein